MACFFILYTLFSKINESYCVTSYCSTFKPLCGANCNLTKKEIEVDICRDKLTFYA